jgi:hypothetical protein
MRIDAPIFTGSFSLNGSTLASLTSVATTGSNTFLGGQSATSFAGDQLTANDRAYLRRIDGITGTTIEIIAPISASAGITGSTNFNTIVNKPTLVSGSSQVIDILSSLNTATASFTPRISNLESKSASVDISITNINSVTASNIARLSNLETKSASVDISITNINTFTASNANTSLNSKTGSYATTGSNTFFGTQTFSGSVYIANDLIVQGSSSIQYISASSVSIGTNIVTLNTANPAVRYAGISVQDSGSATGVTGSMLWDSICNRWIYSNPSGVGYSGGIIMSGPRAATFGTETTLTCNYVAKSGGGDHLYDSCIWEMSGSIGINTNNPGAKLDIQGGTDGDQTISIGSGTTSGIIGSPTNVYINADSDNNSSTGQIQFGFNRTGFSGGASVMTILENGCVGINTNTPTYALDLCTNVPDWAARFYNSNGAGNGFLVRTNNTCTNTTAFGVYNGTQYTMAVLGSGITNFACQICAPSIIGGTLSGTTIYGSNSVCSPSIIACTTSAAAITIDGYSKLSFKDRGTEYGTINASRYNFGGESTMMSFQSGNCFIFLNGTNCLMFIGSSGNVAIGATSNLNNFTIKSSSDTITSGGLSFQSRTTVTNYIAMGLNSSNDFEIQTWTAPSWITRMYIKNDGNIGIGTPTPTAKLHICGPNSDTSGNYYAQLRIDASGTYPDTIAGIALNSLACSQSHIRFMENGNPKFQIRYNAGPSSDNKLKFYSFTTAVDSLIIDGSNNVTCFAGTICASNGVKFYSGASTLNYYEVGTWTPEVIRSSANPTVTYSGTRDGSYVRVGNVVNLWFDFTIATLSGGSGTYYIAGLPFTVSASMAGYSRVVWRDFTAAVPDANTVVSGFAQKTDTYIYPQNDFTGVCFGTKGSTTLQPGRITGFVSYQA